MKQYYWLFHPETLIVNPVPNQVKIRAGQECAPRTALRKSPLLPKTGFQVCVVLNSDGAAIDTEYVPDYRGQKIFNCSNCRESRVITDLGSITDGWTLSEPTTSFDFWTDSGWQTNEQAKFESEVKVINDLRRQQYAQIVDPLLNEARMQRMLGDDVGAEQNELQAQQWYERIREEHPWPQAPEGVLPPTTA